MVQKVALALGAVAIIGVVIALLMGNIVGILDNIWNWIFSDMLKIKNPPPSPFAYDVHAFDVAFMDAEYLLNFNAC